MVKVTPQDIEHLGKISRIKIMPDEVAVLAHEIEAVLKYASKLQEIAQSGHPQLNAIDHGNVMREDSVVHGDRDALLAQAPDREGDYFVVPKIITEK